MAHESFEDEATAAVVNDLFVAVKVDREERPDVDAIYMDAVQAMTGSGGWPMTVFLLPDGRPFFGGTYFPKEARGGTLSFVELCKRIDDVWRTRRDDLVEQAAALTEAISQVGQLAGGTDLPGIDVLDAAVDQLAERFDPEWGGFGAAPKFPSTMNLDTLLRVHVRTGAEAPLMMATTTLDAMAAGGMYDHLGGGFARYSVDRRWLVPHFEKMLYDQALLARAYLHGWQVTGNETYLQVLTETIDYTLEDLGQPFGGLASAEDADSEGVEGKFYVWSLAEVRSVLAAAGLTDTEIDEAVAWWGVSATGNFEGTNILWRPVRGDLLRPEVVERARLALLAHRATRVRPGLDDKVLTEWNALFLATLAEAALATGRDDWQAAATVMGTFLLDRLRREDGRWLRSWQVDGGARHLAYAADHAALVDAFTRLAEATGEARWIAAATETADALLTLFWDDDNGGVFTTGHDAEALVARTKDVMDNATPSANSLAAVALVRLAALTGNATYAARADDILRLLAGPMAKHPTAFGHLLAAVELTALGATEVAVAGDRPDLVDAVASRWRPNLVLAWGEPYDSPLWAGRDAGPDGAGQAYVCRNHACQRPVTTPADLLAQLS